MASIQYIAKSHLVPGHVLGGQYTVNFSATGMKPTIEVNSNQLQSIGGFTETTFFDARESWQITTIPQSAENTLMLREALFSMLDGQVVIFKMLDLENAQVQRAVMIGAPKLTRVPGNQGRFTFNFKLRIEP